MLASLRVYHAGQNPDVQLHEQLEYACVLYNKGFYQQTLRMLERVKLGARQVEMPHIVLLAFDFKKLYFYQAHVWYHTLDQDFRAGYRYAQK